MKIVSKLYRIPEDIAEWLSESKKSANQTLIDRLSNYRRLLSVTKNELRGRFSQAEWSFLADIFNGTIIPDTIRCNASVLVTQIEDACELDRTDERWGIDKAALISKVLALSGAQVDALYTRIEEYWDESNTEPLDEWSDY